MMKKVLICLCIAVLLSAAAPAQQKPVRGETISRPSATSEDGLRVDNFQLIIGGERKAGTAFTVRFKLVNISDHPITFSSEFGVFVGCRFNNQNRDFGHMSKGATIQRKGSITLQVNGTFNAAGHWEFWPAYHTNEHFGPFKWNEIALDISQ